MKVVLTFVRQDSRVFEPLFTSLVRSVPIAVPPQHPFCCIVPDMGGIRDYWGFAERGCSYTLCGRFVVVLKW